MSCECGHESYGAHLRAKRIHVAYCQSWKNFDATRTKNNERELSAYSDARRQGIQPAGTQMGQVHVALDMSDRLGRAFDAGSTSPIIEME